MKKQDRLKTIQLIVYIVAAAVGLYLTLFDADTYHAVAENPGTKRLCVMLWLMFGLAFVFMLLDFNFSSIFKRDYRELDYAVHSDPVSGLRNRLGADALIESYMGKPLPPNFACIMFDMINLRQVNELYGHLGGNGLIKEFSEILSDATEGDCMAARNGGNKFIVIFEDTTKNDLVKFLVRVNEGVRTHNAARGAIHILYRIGISFHEGPEVDNVPAMISLANSRIYQRAKQEEAAAEASHTAQQTQSRADPART